MLKLADVFEALTGVRPPDPSPVISEAVNDSRMVIPACLFVAIKGERTDGHLYVEQAFEKGASLALIKRPLPVPTVDLSAGRGASWESIPALPFAIQVADTEKALQQIAAFWRSKHDLRVVGITGSVGKSTTKELVSEVLSQRYRTLKNLGNQNNEIGLPLTLTRLGEGHQAAVLEMGFYKPGEIKLLCDIARPQIGVVTNVGTVHASRAKTQEIIAQGKAELVQALPASPEGVAILNYDDPWVRPMADMTRARVFYYGMDSKAHLWADQIEGLGLEGIRLTLHYHQEAFRIRVPLIGRHSAHTVLRAAAVGLCEGLSWNEIIAGLQKGYSQLRLVAVHTKEGALVLDDTYNASPESTLAALNLLSDLQGNHIAILGGMFELGQYERKGHEMVGVRAAEVVKQLVTVGDLAGLIADAALSAGMKPSAVLRLATVEEAADYLKSTLKAGDVVLVKGSHSLRMDRIVSSLEVES